MSIVCKRYVGQTIYLRVYMDNVLCCTCAVALIAIAAVNFC